MHPSQNQSASRSINQANKQTTDTTNYCFSDRSASPLHASHIALHTHTSNTWFVVCMPHTNNNTVCLRWDYYTLQRWNRKQREHHTRRGHRTRHTCLLSPYLNYLPQTAHTPRLPSLKEEEHGDAESTRGWGARDPAKARDASQKKNHQQSLQWPKTHFVLLMPCLTNAKK